MDSAMRKSEKKRKFVDFLNPNSDFILVRNTSLMIL